MREAIPSAPDAPFSLWLDAFRWVAALCVVITHTGNRLLTNINDIDLHQRTLIHYGFTFFTGFAHQAVMVFFVLSGFLVGGSLMREWQSTGTVDVRLYLMKRLVRLWVVLLPALVLVVAANAAALWLFNAPSHGVFDSRDVLTRMAPGAFACNALFLQTVACWEYGRNAALWSLSNEFWYYVAFPLLVLGLLPGRDGRRKPRLLLLLAGLLTLLTAFQFTGAWIGPYFVIWLAGVAVALAGRPLVPMRPWVAGVVFAVFVVVTRILIRREVFEGSALFTLGYDLVVMLLFTNLLLCLKTAAHLPPPPLGRLNSRFAGVSFSLYCIHTPILYLFAAASMEWFGVGWLMVPRGAETWVLVMAAMGLCIGSAFAFAHVTEHRTDAVRRTVQRLLAPKTPAPTLPAAPPYPDKIMYPRYGAGTDV